jgi:hypothetical protein
MFGSALPGVIELLPRRLEETPTLQAGDQVRGFGFSHDGAVPALFDFFRGPLGQFGFRDEPGRSGLEKVRELESFLLAFPTGMPPVVGQQVTLHARGMNRALERYSLFEARARAGDGDLVLHGMFEGEARGFLFSGDAAGEARFRSDRKLQRLGFSELAAAVSSGRALLTAMVVPRGSGRRIALDRDEDGAFDRDELDLGFDPAEAESRPPPGGAAGPFVLRGDCNGDGRLNISDVGFTLNYLFLGGSAPECALACDATGEGRLDISDPIYTLAFFFLGGPAPGSYPHCEPGAEECVEACEE